MDSYIINTLMQSMMVLQHLELAWQLYCRGLLSILIMTFMFCVIPSLSFVTVHVICKIILINKLLIKVFDPCRSNPYLVTKGVQNELSFK